MTGEKKKGKKEKNKRRRFIGTKRNHMCYKKKPPSSFLFSRTEPFSGSFLPTTFFAV